MKYLKSTTDSVIFEVTETELYQLLDAVDIVKSDICKKITNSTDEDDILYLASVLKRFSNLRDNLHQVRKQARENNNN